jgi:PAS domain S-box-containing protein
MGEVAALDLTGVSSLDEAARLVASALAPRAPAGIWVTEAGHRRRLGDADAPVPATARERVRVTAGCGAEIEVAGPATAELSTAAITLAAVADRLHAEARAGVVERQLAATELAATEHAERAAQWFEALVDASPDAIVVVDRGGRITSVNPQAERLFGHDAATLMGMSVDDLLPEHTSGRHARLRAEFAADPTTRPMAAGTDLEAMRSDGTLVAVDIALTPLGSDGGVAAFVRDATLRRQAEHDRRRVTEADLRRRQALELNDNVVQGLVALLWELEEHSVPAGARRSAERTLAAARDMMSDLLDDLPEDHETLVRTRQLAEDTPPSIPVPRADPTHAGRIRVAIADDAAELRMLLRLRLQRLQDVEIVGEAENGREAVEICEQHEPDLVLLDLSMPVLGGLQAAEQIRLRSPDTRIYVLSGYPEDSMRSRAVAAGADAYYEKSSSLEEVCGAVAELTRSLSPGSRPNGAR